MMCYHLARLMDSVLPEKKKNHFVETVPKKMHSNIAVWYVFRVLAIYEVPTTSVFCLFVFRQDQTEHWHRFPRGAVGSPSLEISKKPPGRGPGQPTPGGPA